jgi:hypothetical protein
MMIRLPLVAAFLVVGVIHLSAATIPVTSTADSGAGSLRAALASAGNGHVIVFSWSARETCHTAMEAKVLR